LAACSSVVWGAEVPFVSIERLFPTINLMISTVILATLVTCGVASEAPHHHHHHRHHPQFPAHPHGNMSLPAAPHLPRRQHKQAAHRRSTIGVLHNTAHIITLPKHPGEPATELMKADVVEPVALADEISILRMLNMPQQHPVQHAMEIAGRHLGRLVVAMMVSAVIVAGWLWAVRVRKVNVIMQANPHGSHIDIDVLCFTQDAKLMARSAGFGDVMREKPNHWAWWCVVAMWWSGVGEMRIRDKKSGVEVTIPTEFTDPVFHKMRLPCAAGATSAELTLTWAPKWGFAPTLFLRRLPGLKVRWSAPHPWTNTA